MQAITKYLRRDKKEKNNALNVGYIGIDVRHEGINLAQLQRQRDGEITVRAQVSVASDKADGSLLDSPGELKKLLHNALRSARFKGRKVVAALDSQHVKLIPLSYANKSQGLEEAIDKLMQDRIEGDVQDYVIDYLPVRSQSTENEQMALVSLAERKEVTRFLELLSAAGLTVEALDIRPAALTRLVETISIAADYETLMVITFGESKSFLTIISGRRLLFDQEIQFGEKQLLELIASALEMSYEQAKELFYRYGLKEDKTVDQASVSGNGEDFSEVLLDIAKPVFLQLIDEISRILVFVSAQTRGRPVSEVYLCGSMTGVKGIDDFLADMLDMSVKPLYDEYQQLFQEKVTQTSHEAFPGMVIAAGLALRGMTQDA